MSNPALEKDPALSSLSPEGILTLTFNRPKALNAMNDWVYNAATKILEQAAKNDAVKVVVVTGSGDKSFCAGADLGAGFDPMVGPLKSGRGSYFDPVGEFFYILSSAPLFVARISASARVINAVVHWRSETDATRRCIFCTHQVALCPL